MRRWIVILGMFSATVSTAAWAHGQGKVSAAAKNGAAVPIQLPAGGELFPDGKGVDLANGYCLMCHSADMVLMQPPLTLVEWTAEINKMRKAYGCPLGEEQVAGLAAYFAGLKVGATAR